MNPVLIDLGFIKIYWYSICILLGLIVGGLLILRESQRFKISKDDVTNLFLWVVIIAIIGARIYYVLFNLDYYAHNIIDIFKVWEGGLAIHGGIIFGLIALIIFTKKHNIDTLRMLDAIVVGLIIGQAIGRWGNFFNGEAHGMATTFEFLNGLHLPKFIINGMNIYGTYYHPTFLYESLWCLIGFVILLILRRRKHIKVGQITGCYFLWYGIGRFFIESMRTDSLMLGPIKVAQLVSVLMSLAGLTLIVYKSFSKKKYNEENNL